MIEGWVLWLVLVGLAVGAVAVGLVLIRLPREETDVDAVERHEEAAWISSTIERHGGIAPQSLVEEVLDLHQAYLRHPRRPLEPLPGSAPAHDAAVGVAPPDGASGAPSAPASPPGTMPPSVSTPSAPAPGPAAALGPASAGYPPPGAPPPGPPPGGGRPPPPTSLPGQPPRPPGVDQPSSGR